MSDFIFNYDEDILNDADSDLPLEDGTYDFQIDSARFFKDKASLLLNIKCITDGSAGRSLSFFVSLLKSEKTKIPFRQWLDIVKAIGVNLRKLKSITDDAKLVIADDNDDTHTIPLQGLMFSAETTQRDTDKFGKMRYGLKWIKPCESATSISEMLNSGGY